MPEWSPRWPAHRFPGRACGVLRRPFCAAVQHHQMQQKEAGMAKKKGPHALTRRTLLQGLSAVGASAGVYNALAAFHVPPALAAETTGQIPPNVGNNKRVVILGAGIGGLVAAFELQRHNFQCTVLEVNDRVGGRSLTLRRGDVLKEVPENGDATEQTCTFDLEEDENPDDLYNQPYLNAGPGRIPSAHVNLLRYCHELKIPLEV